ncbi:hypothetical protein PTTG_09166 [Puccinia triticina 1-1 BBBD Race 1]|uniref:DNA 3'-5' helicase n=1 Tax=Puccinia triticina (isolate 1-1 / race 1 (BBBD)) TaxID=630390 RepID=A0A180GXB7_PUCT1|nr:hypothetical protein PTTG_09166 [Puccinia triticina 1-1 BBBD Race 1]
MTGIQVGVKIKNSGNDELNNMIKLEALERYNQEAKPLQVNTVANLFQGRNTFLLAATGFGKSRITEIYLNMLPKDRHRSTLGVVVVLIPLDSLGSNQVDKKVVAGYTAINLTKANFTNEACLDIRDGVYNFVYLSPEMFLDNKTFSNIYFSPNFQSKLALVVVDEAHMIYLWGLVEGGQKNIKTMYCATPGFCSLGGQLLTKNNAPLLLMLATGRPGAIAKIKKNLKLLDTHIDILRSELTRPEIRII